MIPSGYTGEWGSFDEYPYYDGKGLEIVFTPQKTKFTVWSPAVQGVRINLYTTGEGGEPYEQIKMERADKGTWRATIHRNLEGHFYTFQIYMHHSWHSETPGIWAKAIGVNGKRAAIIDWTKTYPENWEKDKAPALKNFTDSIIYEMHHRDFSMHPSSGIRNKGKFLALTEEGTINPDGEWTGIEHLKELGVTHIHLLPSFDFATIDETRLQENKYNWGYDPQNYNVPEGSYSTNPYDPITRIKEMKEMVQSLHKHGLRVVMDVVYNHTYATKKSNFSRLAPGYFYRYNADGSYSDASACGNEIASERSMVRHYIVESLKFWVHEYHIDGFRFDLMGIHDIETMVEIRKALTEIDPTIFIYGEGWTAGKSPLPASKRATKENIKKLDGIAVFSDEIRDALKGSVFYEKQEGFVSGKTRNNENIIKYCIMGAIEHPHINYYEAIYSRKSVIHNPYPNEPSQVINYVSCHDDLCLVDKLKVSAPQDTTKEELIKFNKLAQTIVFTSQGIPFIRAGEEVGHSKNGVHNSYKSNDSINAIDWRLKTKNKDLFIFYKGLIELRKRHPAFRISTAERVGEHFRFIDTHQPGVIAYSLAEHANGDDWKEIIVILNGNRWNVTVFIPEKKWTVVCRNGQIREEGLQEISGGNIEVEASSALIIYC